MGLGRLMFVVSSGWCSDCDPQSGWELGWRYAGRQNRNISNFICWGKLSVEASIILA